MIFDRQWRHTSTCQRHAVEREHGHGHELPVTHRLDESSTFYPIVLLTWPYQQVYEGMVTPSYTRFYARFHRK